jgi:hypothetical protein
MKTLTTKLRDLDRRDLERKSSAVTLSDMEVFIFPELMYALLLANVMSPRIWKWRDDPWFAGIETMTPYRRITRLKQYVMDHYAFNLDLDTWGLTSKQREVERFQDYVNPEALSQSNALFGYEGDKYYFDIDIRTSTKAMSSLIGKPRRWRPWMPSATNPRTLLELENASPWPPCMRPPCS